MYTEFLWTFPCYALATNVNLDPKTGDPILDDQIGFVAPPMWTEGRLEQQLALFTDFDLAERYLAKCNPSLGLKVFSMPTPHALVELLTRAEGRYSTVVIDLSPPNRLGQSRYLTDVLAFAQAKVRQLDQSDPQ